MDSQTNLKEKEIDDNIEKQKNILSNLKKVDDIINLKKDLCKEICFYHGKIEKLRKLLNLVEDKLYKICVHDWKKDYTHTGEHSQYICSICESYK